MKRWLWICVIIVLAALVASTPFKGRDVAKLIPVEVIWLSESQGDVYLETDTGDSGLGTSVQDALENMKQSVAGTLFLETADYLILNQEDEYLLEQVYPLLRPTCMICTASKTPDMENIAKFLSAHEPDLTLRQYRVREGDLPVLEEKDGRYFWVGE